MSKSNGKGSLTLGELLLLLIALLGVWSLAVGQPVWEWFR